MVRYDAMTLNPKNQRVETGKAGEEIAERFLCENGLSIIGKNIRTEYGEIDILAEEEDCLVFVEVKTRRSKKFGFPEEAVNFTKQDHMINSAQSYLQEQNGLDRMWRVDVIAINLGQRDSPQIRWFKNAING